VSVGTDPPLYESYQVRNSAFKTSNAEMQRINCDVIYSNVKLSIN